MEVAKEAAAEVVVEKPETVVAGADAGTSDAGNVDAEARDMGWVPQAEWRGPADKWRPAEEFVQRGREILPIIRAREKAKDAELAKLRKEVGSHADTVKRIERMTQVALDRQRDQIESKYAERKEAAVETGDKDAFRAAEKAEKAELKDLADKAKAEPEKKADGALSADEHEAFLDWQEENTWFKADPEMTRLADLRFDRLRRSKPDLSFPEVLTEVRKAIEEKFPEKFEGRKTAKSRSPVEGGARVPNGGAPEKLASKLPADVRATAERFVKEGLFKSVDDYAKSYFE